MESWENSSVALRHVGLELGIQFSFGLLRLRVTAASTSSSLRASATSLDVALMNSVAKEIFWLWNNFLHKLVMR